VDRIVEVFGSFDHADLADDQFYRELAPEDRLEMLLELIERHRSAFGEAANRFEKVHRLVDLSQDDAE
jgi:hypothetical protein